MKLLFDLRCRSCAHEFEHRVDAQYLTEEPCPKCNEREVLEIIHRKAPPVHYKGKWFKNGGY